ncbi:hypothetical protein CP533_1300 [Ophiocordyceps camponoti-saundersi (nom. inval.)]|nr:hypothetical protein CP533_1300 [Ophiocordyceps camponoti-saundersi (nom. inval.)]
MLLSPEAIIAILGLIVALPPVILVIFKLARRFRSTPSTNSQPAIRSIPSEFLTFHLWLLSQFANTDIRTADEEMALDNHPVHNTSSYSIIAGSSDEE